MRELPPPLLALAALEQFVCWIAVPKLDPSGAVVSGKFDKLPVSWSSGRVISAHDPREWTSAACALAMHAAYDRGHGSGVGFVFTANDPFFFLDIDGALQPDGTWSKTAVDLCAWFPGAAVEVSHGGKGLHVIGRTAPVNHGCKNTALGLELYTAERFVALTGAGAVGDAITDCTAALSRIAHDLFPPIDPGAFTGWTPGPVPEWVGPADDEELLRMALASGQRTAAAAFTANREPVFADLWEGRADVLGVKWPHETNAYDASHADMALANHLAYWTGKDCDRMERLMRRSGLARDKWDVHRTYLENTILRACSFVSNVLTMKGNEPALPPPPSPEVVEQAAAAGGFQLRTVGREYMGSADQMGYFSGCVYVEDLNAIYSVPRQTLYKQAAFDVRYGGFQFIVDTVGKKTKDSAWEAFTKNRVFAPEIVTKLCFRPHLEPAERVVEGNYVLLNTYVPYHPLTFPGDVGPFLDFLARILPDEGDRKILLHYLASMVQNPGYKFQWWPVLQGVEGNGKTLFIRLMTYLMGERYTHLPNAQAMARDGLKFNSWIEGRLFIGIEEINVSGRRDFLEEFKPVVTNERIGQEGKGTNQVTGDNYVNGILCTNHKDGVPITTDGRRYAVFYTAQQADIDLHRDGMGGDYFPRLYQWLRGRGEWSQLGANYGAAVIGHYLQNFELEEALDPARGAVRAPRTSSHLEAIANSRGRAEQEVLEAIAEGRLGFMGGWVSSTYLDILLQQIKINVPRSKRREMMGSLGYIAHPHLSDGRTNENVQPDGKKPVLYIRKDHVACNIQKAVEIGRAYSRAQEAKAANDVSPAQAAFG